MRASRPTFSPIDNVFLSKLLDSLKQNFISQGAGAAQPNISRIKIVNTIIPLPPLAEQKRLVEKIDRLMEQCEQLEQLGAVREQKRVLIHTSAREKLLKASDQETFGQAWDFIQENFGELYAVKENVTSLRQVILQLAVMGKLVPQDPNDPPASELLKEIEAEKQRLIKEGKLKKQKPLPEITAAEIPYDLPHGWQITRLASITNIVRGGSPRPAKDPRFYDGNIPFLKVADLTANDDMYLDSYTYSIKEAGLIKTRMVPPLTLMLTNSGATLGVPKICKFQTTLNDGIAAFIFMNENLYKPYFYYLLKSKTKWFLEVASRGQGQPNLNTDIIGDTIIGLPPLPEQRRIVAKVDALTALCDRLENEIDRQTNPTLRHRDGEDLSVEIILNRSQILFRQIL